MIEVLRGSIKYEPGKSGSIFVLENTWKKPTE